MENYKLWNQIPQQLLHTCSKFDRLWLTRRRRFDTYSVLSTVLKVISDSNQSYQNALRSLDFTGVPPAASSLCEVRSKISASIFGMIRNELLEFWDDLRLETNGWHGFEAFAIDGTKVNIPRECEGEGFYRASNSYYPQALITGLLRVSDRMLCDLDFSSQSNERSAAIRLIEGLGSKDLVIYDKGYLSYLLLAHHQRIGADAIFRVQAGTTFKAIEEFRKSDLEDDVIELTLNPTTFKRLAKSSDINIPSSIRVRLIKYTIGREEHILLSTITREAIPAQDFKDLYMKRWLIEELYKILKCRIDIENFHSKTANGVEQEVHAAGLLWNLSRKLESFAPRSAFKKSRSVPSYIALSG